MVDLYGEVNNTKDSSDLYLNNYPLNINDFYDEIKLEKEVKRNMMITIIVIIACIVMASLFIVFTDNYYLALVLAILMVSFLIIQNMIGRAKLATFHDEETKFNYNGTYNKIYETLDKKIIDERSRSITKVNFIKNEIYLGKYFFKKTNIIRYDDNSSYIFILVKKPLHYFVLKKNDEDVVNLIDLIKDNFQLTLRKVSIDANKTNPYKKLKAINILLFTYKVIGLLIGAIIIMMVAFLYSEGQFIV
ncbi:hypothetical protein LJB88_02495 [Erysipelotrichaceae bacterium OttesenSCG-928-M19]|nr:hypothetical protein [Erysipelotrichaceae bacterium OttesenSCG-928-M19]